MSATNWASVLRMNRMVAEKKGELEAYEKAIMAEFAAFAALYDDEGVDMIMRTALELVSIHRFEPQGAAH
jgi:hypothetical protein